MQAHDVRARTRQHDIHFFQQVGGIIRRDDLDGYFHVILPSLRSVHCAVRSESIIGKAVVLINKDGVHNECYIASHFKSDSAKVVIK